MKITIYFVLYVAMVLELLIFIVDRDDAEEELEKRIETNVIADGIKPLWQKQLELYAPPNTSPMFIRGWEEYEDTTRIVISVFGFLSEEDRKNIMYECYCDSPNFESVRFRVRIDNGGNQIFSKKLVRPNQPEVDINAELEKTLPSYLRGDTLIRIDKNGNCVFQRKFVTDGIFEFKVNAKLKRTLPGYLQDKINIEKLTDPLRKVFSKDIVGSDTAKFKIDVTGIWP